MSTQKKMLKNGKRVLSLILSVLIVWNMCMGNIGPSLVTTIASEGEEVSDSGVEGQETEPAAGGEITPTESAPSGDATGGTGETPESEAPTEESGAKLTISEPEDFKGMYPGNTYTLSYSLTATGDQTKSAVIEWSVSPETYTNDGATLSIASGEDGNGVLTIGDLEFGKTLGEKASFTVTAVAKVDDEVIARAEYEGEVQPFVAFDKTEWENLTFIDVTDADTQKKLEKSESDTYAVKSGKEPSSVEISSKGNTYTFYRYLDKTGELSKWQEFGTSMSVTAGTYVLQFKDDKSTKTSEAITVYFGDEPSVTATVAVGQTTAKEVDKNGKTETWYAETKDFEITPEANGIPLKVYEGTKQAVIYYADKQGITTEDDLSMLESNQVKNNIVTFDGTLCASDSVYFYVKDIMGNVSAASDACAVGDIDTTDPVITAKAGEEDVEWDENGNATYYTNDASVAYTFAFSDNETGIGSVTVNDKNLSESLNTYTTKITQYSEEVTPSLAPEGETSGSTDEEIRTDIGTDEGGTSGDGTDGSGAADSGTSESDGTDGSGAADSGTSESDGTDGSGAADSGAEEGNYVYNFAVTNGVGIAKNATFTVVYDVTAPTFEFDATQLQEGFYNSENAGKEQSVIVKVSDSGSGLEGTLSYVVKNGDETIYTKGVTITEGTASIPLTHIDGYEGVYTYELTASDLAGNSNEEPYKLEIVWDTEGPDITISSKDGYYNAEDAKNENLTRTVTIKDDVSGLNLDDAVYKNISYTVKDSKKNELSGYPKGIEMKKPDGTAEGAAVDEITVEIPLDALSSDTYTYTVTVTDAAENTSSKEFDVKWDIDAPTCEDITVDESNSILKKLWAFFTKEQEVTISVKATDNVKVESVTASYQVETDGKITEEKVSLDGDTGVADDGAAVFTYTYTVSVDKDAEITLNSVTIADVAGNETVITEPETNPKVSHGTIVIDQTNPILSVQFPEGGKSQQDKDDNILYYSAENLTEVSTANGTETKVFAVDMTLTEAFFLRDGVFEYGNNTPNTPETDEDGNKIILYDNHYGNATETFSVQRKTSLNAEYEDYYELKNAEGNAYTTWSRSNDNYTKKLYFEPGYIYKVEYTMEDAVKHPLTGVSDTVVNKGVYTVEFAVPSQDATIDSISIVEEPTYTDKNGAAYYNDENGLKVKVQITDQFFDESGVTLQVTKDDAAETMDLNNITWNRSEKATEPYTWIGTAVIGADGKYSDITASYKDRTGREEISKVLTTGGESEEATEEPEEAAVVILDRTVPEFTLTASSVNSDEEKAQPEIYEIDDVTTAYYQNPVTLTVTVEDAFFDVKALKDGEKVPIEVTAELTNLPVGSTTNTEEIAKDIAAYFTDAKNWSQDSGSWSCTYEVSVDANYRITVNGKDLATNSGAEVSEATDGEKKFDKFVIDSAAPKVNIGFSSEASVSADEVSYFNGEDGVSVVVTVEEHNPDFSKFSAELTAKDVNDQDVDVSKVDVSKIKADFIKTLQNEENWENDANNDKWSLTYQIEQEANYQLKIVLTDESGRNGEDTKSFTYDNTAPVVTEASVSDSNEDGSWFELALNELREFFTKETKLSVVVKIREEIADIVAKSIQITLKDTNTNAEYVIGGNQNEFKKSESSTGEVSEDKGKYIFTYTATLNLPSEDEEGNQLAYNLEVVSIKVSDIAKNNWSDELEEEKEQFNRLVLDNLPPVFDAQFSKTAVASGTNTEDADTLIFKDEVDLTLDVWEDAFRNNSDQYLNEENGGAEESYEVIKDDVSTEKNTPILKRDEKNSRHYSAEFHYVDGAYTVRYQMKDALGTSMTVSQDSSANVNDEGVYEQSFIVDTIAPKLTVSYDEASAFVQETEKDHISYFEGETVTVTLDVEETNFDKGSDNLLNGNASQTLKVERYNYESQDYEDVTSSGISDIYVKDEAEEGRIKHLAFSEEGRYRISYTTADIAGNEMKAEDSETAPYMTGNTYVREFVIDRTAPACTSFAMTDEADKTITDEKGTIYYYGQDHQSEGVAGEINITEMNFDPAEVIVRVQRTDLDGKTSEVVDKGFTFGEAPNLEFASGATVTVTWNPVSREEGTYQASFKVTGDADAADGDYVFSVEYTDQTEKVLTGTCELKTIALDYIVPTIGVVLNTNDGTSRITEYNGDVYYNGPVTLTVTVEEHNFDPDLMEFAAVFENGPYNSEGVQQIVTSLAYDPTAWQQNGNVYTYVINVDKDGTYALTVTGKDIAGNDYVVEQGKENSVDRFVVDDTQPILEIAYSEPLANRSTAECTRYYNASTPAKITFTVTEHNFDPAIVADSTNLTAVADTLKATYISGTDVSVSEVAGLQAYLRDASSWTTVGDVHTATYAFDSNAVYTLEQMKIVDLAGNAVEHKNSGISDVFIVDKTAPNDIRYEVTKHQFGPDTYLSYQYFDPDYIEVTATVQNDFARAYDFGFTATDISGRIITGATPVSTGARTFVQNGTREETKYTMILPSDFKGKISGKAEDYSVNTLTVDCANGLIAESESMHNTTGSITIAPDRAPNANGFYNSDVYVTVRMSDTYSGIRTISWNGNVGNESRMPVGYDYTSADDVVYSYNETRALNASTFNSNHVNVTASFTDNAGRSMQQSQPLELKIDNVKPAVSVTYDLNDPANGRYYNKTRTATVQVTERNFDESRVNFTYTSQHGSAPSISGWTCVAGSPGESDDTIWQATVTFASDDDYTFTFTCTDLADNESDPVETQSFTIDQTAPVISVSYQNKEVANGKYYKADQVGVVTVTEHNFEQGTVQTDIKASLDGVSFSAPQLSAFSGGGDVHTARVNYTQDGDYSFTVSYTDAAGNVSAAYVTDYFTVDKTVPEIVINGVENQKAYPNAVTPQITFTDVNYKSDGISWTLTRLADFMDGNSRDQKADYTYTKTNAVSGHGEVISYSDFAYLTSVDGIYELSASVTDMAGNVTEVEGSSMVFSVNRFGSTYMLEDEQTKELLDKGFVNAEEEVVYTEINPNKVYHMEKQGDGSDVRVEGSEIWVTYDNNSTPSSDLLESGNYSVKASADNSRTWNAYTYTIYKENFENEGHYEIMFKSTDEGLADDANKEQSRNASDAVLEELLPEQTGDETKQELADGKSRIRFTVDKTAPTVVISGIEENEIYNAEVRDVSIDASDSIALDSVEVFVDGESEMLESEIYTAQGGYVYALQEYRQPRTVKVVVTDRAGNSSEKTLTGVLVSSSGWVRFYNNKPLFVGSIVGVVVVIGGIIFLILFLKRRKDKDEEEQQAQA